MPKSIMRILVCEDTKDLNKLIVKTLEKNGYATDSAFDGKEGLEFAFAADYDAIILDVMMPKIDGFEMLKQLRTVGKSTPVLFLTARDAVEDRVKGLDMGGDDYLIKPFDFDELLARIRVMVRKSAGVRGETYKLADLELDPLGKTAKRQGQVIPLIPKEYALLEFMIRNKGVVLSTAQLEDSIWSFEEGGSSNNIAVYVSRLRKKIDEGFDVKLIHTIRGVGYVLRAE